MKTNLLKIMIALGLVTIAGGTAAAEIRQSNMEKQQAETTSVVHLVKKVPTDKDIKRMNEKSKKAVQTVSNEKKETIKDTEIPVVSGANVTVEKGADVNIFDGVTATDKKDGDISTALVSSAGLDTSKVGTQVIRFSATDKSGNTGWLDRTFTIVEPQPAAPAQPETKTVEAAPAAEPVNVPASAPAAPTYQAMTMYINGQAIPYQNGGQGSGQSIIDANPSGTASTWGGAPVQSGSDGMNTHFIGHNPGIFSAIFGLGMGSSIVVTDGSGNATTYVVNNIMQVNDYGVEVGTGQNVWDLTVGTGGGERITLQSCINDDVNLFVLASKA